MNRFPFLTLPQALVALRVTTAVMFMAHALVRILNGTIPRFADFLSDRGFVFSLAFVWALTVFELLGGAAMIIGKHTRWVAAGFMAIAAGGIVIIHAAQGWFVGEHGTGGVEYSLVLLVACFVIAAADGSPQPATA